MSIRNPSRNPGKFKPPKPRRPKAVAPPGSVDVTTPGWEPDWQSIIKADPAYQGLLNQQIAQSAQDKAARNTSLANALINFGAVPATGLGDVGDFSVDPATLSAAAANTGSIEAKLNRQHDLQLRGLQDTLAAHGILRSGALRSGVENENTNFANAQADAVKALLQALGGYQGDFATAERNRNTDLNNLFSSLLPAYSSDPNYQARSSETVKAKYDPNSGMYRDVDGNYYDRSGNHVLPPGEAGVNRARRRRHRPAPLPPVRPPHPGYQP